MPDDAYNLQPGVRECDNVIDHCQTPEMLGYRTGLEGLNALPGIRTHSSIDNDLFSRAEASPWCPLCSPTMS